MKVYNFSWSWWEDYSPCILIHNDDKTTEMFKQDCELAMREVGNAYLDQETSWPNCRYWIDFAIGYMIDHLGYIRPEEVSYGLWGNYIIEKEEPKEKEYQELESIVGKELMDKANAKSEKIKNNMYKK